MSAALDCAPAHYWIPEHDGTDGPDVAELGTALGFDRDAGASAFLDAVFAYRGELPAAREAAIICARQNLKTATLMQVAVGAMYLLEERIVIWTAHLTSTAREAFVELDGRIAGVPDLARRVAKVRRVNGEQEIELRNGSRLLFRARSTGGGRGLTGNRIILDEAYALTPEHIGALIPVTSSVAEAQIIYASSAGHARSGTLRKIRDRGRAGSDPYLAYLEYCAPEVECTSADCDHGLTVQGCALDDEALWYRANPALGRRISIDAVRAERRSMAPEEFARERLGWWDDPASTVDLPIDLDEWSSCADVERPERVRFAVSASFDLEWVSIAAAGLLRDGRTFVSLVKRDRGSAWVAEALKSYTAQNPGAVVIDPASPAATMIADLVKLGIDVEHPSRSEYAQACVKFADSVTRGRIAHGAQPHVDGLVAIAKRRPLGQLWIWLRSGPASLDVSPLEAMTLAANAASTENDYELLESIY